MISIHRTYSLCIPYDLTISRCFGVGTSYFVVIGDLMPDVMEGFLPSDKSDSVWTNRQLWIFIFSSIFIFPGLISEHFPIYILSLDRCIVIL